MHFFITKLRHTFTEARHHHTQLHQMQKHVNIIQNTIILFTLVQLLCLYTQKYKLLLFIYTQTTVGYDDATTCFCLL